MCVLCCFFFFFKQKTAYEMRISDWSSDVCSSDLIAIGGLSGTGKSTLARTLGDAVGRPPGARILRSDVLRKRLAGVFAETPLPASGYTAEASRATYMALDGLAWAALATGQGVIADRSEEHTSELQSLMRTY